MARPRELDRPDFKGVKAALDALAPDHPVDGRDAILAWFQAHGFRCSWRTLLDWQRRLGQPFAFHLPAIGVHRGRPVSTHHLLLAWCMAQAEGLGPPWSRHWKPSPRALRKRRHSRATSA